MPIFGLRCTKHLFGGWALPRPTEEDYNASPDFSSGILERGRDKRRKGNGRDSGKVNGGRGQVGKAGVR